MFYKAKLCLKVLIYIYSTLYVYVYIYVLAFEKSVVGVVWRQGPCCLASG